MKRLFSSFSTIFLALMIASGCVSVRKYKKSLAELELLEKQAKVQKRQIQKLQADSSNISEQADHLVRMLGVEKKAKQVALNETEEYRSLRDKIFVQNEQLEKLKKGILHALIEFETEDLQVHIEHGKVYVSMPSKLLFNMGGTSIGTHGKEALEHLSEVLKHHQDIQILVEGHTDNIPVKAGNTSFKDNWELSTARATRVARILAGVDKLDPKRITVVGKGEFEPVADNASLEGRQQNRRVEIVLSPRLEELMETIVFTDLKKEVLEHNKHITPYYNYNKYKATEETNLPQQESSEKLKPTETAYKGSNNGLKTVQNIQNARHTTNTFENLKNTANSTETAQKPKLKK